MASLIRATNLWGYSDLVRELGADPEPFLSRFHIPPGVEYEDDAFISFEAFVRMLEASAADLDCPDFGLRLSRWQGLDVLGPIAVIARNAQTLLEGLEAIARYFYVHSPALSLTVEPRTVGTNVRFTYEVTERGLPDPLQGYELSMANGARIIRLLGGPEARPRAISFMHEQLGSMGAYRDALESHYLQSTATLSERVVELTRRLLPTGQCSADAIADQLAMHPRMLQRRLATERVRCQDLIDRERRDQAARYLADARLHLSQIAGLLGYSEQSALNRSCRRWFGKTPRQYRADFAVSPSRLDG
jgi:AraC-like DNA-binding protein